MFWTGVLPYLHTDLNTSIAAMEVPLAKGTVKWFDPGRGFGFIEARDFAEDVFAHFSQISMDGFRTLRDGQKVEFEVVQGPRGASAADIRPIASDTPDNGPEGGIDTEG